MVVWQFNLYKGRWEYWLDRGEIGMSDSSLARTNVAALLAILALSAATMVWLFWHFPVITTVATVAILLGLGVCARLARLTDSDMTDFKQTEPSV
jgi:Flp pilus assembly protein TadB